MSLSTSNPSPQAQTTLQGHSSRNPSMALNLSWLDTTLYAPAVRHLANTLSKKRVLSPEVRTAWLLKAVTCIDLTTLAGDDTPERVARLCAKAKRPIRDDIVAELGIETPIEVAAVCVYHPFITAARRALAGTAIPVAVVSTGFPAGFSPMASKLEEIRASVADGASEIDVVITRSHVLTGDWQALFDEVCAFREACGEAHLKVIVATGELGSLRNIYRASMVSLMAGADFIKTSTGKESINATLPVSLVMARAIRAYAEHTGYMAGFKPAGGIRTSQDAIHWLVLMKEVLGRPWLEPTLFRFGASSLLGDIEKTLDQQLTGYQGGTWRYSLA